MTVSTSAARHLLVRFTEPARLPDALLAALRDEVVLAGWVRASGVLTDVQIRALDPRTGAASQPRRIAGAVQVIALEGSVGLAGGDVSCGMRVVLARETDAGLDTIAGDLVEARIDALEVLITAFDEVTATRQLDRAGVWVLDATEGAPRPAAPAPAPAPAPALPIAAAAPVQAGFAEVVRAAEVEAQKPAPAPAPAPVPPPAPSSSPSVAPPAPPRPSPTFSMSNAIPARIARPAQAETEDEPVPEPGDVVEHFAFGRCEVVKSDGDRLHVRLGKDQRIKEIALEMLRVTPLPSEEGQTTRHFKLARKL